MASKSRGGLSAREYAAKTAGKAMPYSSSSSNSVSSGGLKAPKAPKTGSFKFDSSKLVPTYQAEAASIYNPQVQQIQGLQALTKSQAEDAKVKTKDEFAQLLKREQENINRRGAFFSGGAIDQENRIGAQEGGALRDIGYQEQQANLQYQGTLSEIAQAQKDYVSSKVEGAYSSAYKAFQDKIANQMNQYQLELGQYNTDRAYNQSVIESDRNYKLAAAASARAGSNAAGSSAELKATADAFNRNNGNWDATAKELADKGFDVGEGSAIDNELRRRNGLAPITKANNKPMAAGIADDFATMDVLNGYAKELIAKDDLPGTSGWLGGTIAQGAAKLGLEFGTGGAEGQQVRNQIGNIQATIAKLRGGTSFTENEQRLLETYTPTINDADFVKKQKLEDLSRFIEDKKTIMQAYLGGSSQSVQNVNNTYNPTIKAFDINGEPVLISQEEMNTGNFKPR